ncbi:MAG: hypothetical protein NTY99_01685, partial [DPANN group archaeon]|nr:hypothetical protein [DPANN group archaeon]
FENLSPTGALVYMLKQLKDKNLIDPERTEMPTMMSMWGARCGVKSAEDLEVHIVCQDLSGRKTTLSAAFSYDQGQGIGICECAFPQTKQAADDIVGRIETSIKSYRNEL